MGHPGTHKTQQLFQGKYWFALKPKFHNPCQWASYCITHTSKNLVTCGCQFYHWFCPSLTQTVIMDWFSKSLWLIPLPSLPSMFETAQLIFNHVFRYFGIPYHEWLGGHIYIRSLAGFHGKVGCLCKHLGIIPKPVTNPEGPIRKLDTSCIFLCKLPRGLGTIPSTGWIYTNAITKNPRFMAQNRQTAVSHQLGGLWIRGEVLSLNSQCTWPSTMPSVPHLLPKSPNQASGKNLSCQHQH